MISINSLSHSLGGEKILDCINLDIPDGTILGLVGINGAGKSTLLRLLSGVYIPNEGKISFDGASPVLESTRKNIFFLPDDPFFTHQATIKSVFEMYKALYSNIDMALYERLINEFGLNTDKPLRNFSKGMRRQAYITVALSIRPKYLLLDEAFDGLDPLSRKTVKDEIIKMVDEDDSTVIISSHSLRELEDFCDMYAIISDKTVKSYGDISEKVNSYCKFMLAFADKIPENVFDGLPVISVSESGKFIKGVFEGNPSEIEERLTLLKPAAIERLPVDFEEAFISDVSRRNENEEL